MTRSTIDTALGFNASCLKRKILIGKFKCNILLKRHKSPERSHVKLDNHIMSLYLTADEDYYIVFEEPLCITLPLNQYSNEDVYLEMDCIDVPYKIEGQKMPCIQNNYFYVCKHDNRIYKIIRKTDHYGYDIEDKKLVIYGIGVHSRFNGSDEFTLHHYFETEARGLRRFCQKLHACVRGARKIQRQYRCAIVDPCYLLCRNRLYREWEECRF